MKYEEENYSSKENKSNTGLIIAIAVAILIIAVAAWFALSRFNSGKGALDDMVSDTKSSIGGIYDETKSDINSMTSDIKSDLNSFTSDVKSEYESFTSSYNDTVSGNMSGDTTSGVTKPTGDSVSSVPYSKTFSKPTEGKIAKEFSDKELVYSKTFGDMRLHSGVDIECKKGTSVSACGDGKILNIDESSQYGTVVSIDLGNGLTAKYSSLSNLKVKAGDSVKAGDILGSTSTIPAECNDKDHLHFEIFKNGVAVDPFKALNLD